MRQLATTIFFLMLFINSSNAQLIEIPAQADQTVTPYFSVLEDSKHSLKLIDLVSSTTKDQLEWHPIDKQTLSMGVSNSQFWLKTTIKNTSDKAQQLLLEISYPGLSKVDLYLVNKNQAAKFTVDKETISFDELVKNRKIKSVFPVFEINTAANSEYELYLSTRSIYPVVLPIKLKSLGAYQTEEQFRLTFNGIFFGSMFAMIIFNFFLCLVTRDKSYAWYVTFEILAVLVVSFDQGIIPAMIRSHGIETSFTLFNLICLVNSMAAGKFAISYLSLGEKDPFLKKLALSGVYVAFFLIWIVLFLRDSSNTLLIFLLLIVYGSVAMYIGFRRSKKGDPFARFYLVAWSFAISFGMISTAARFGAFDYNLFTQYAFHFGYVAEAAVFSLGLGYRINMLSRERQKEKEKVIQAQAEVTKDRAINEERIKSRTQFFASMSHEFRTPLTTILGYSDIAQDPKTEETKRLEYLKTISLSAQHMLQLINDILDFSKIEARKMEIHILPVNLFELLFEIKDMVNVLAERKGIEFNIEYQFPLPSTVQTDATRVKQVLVNLTANAIKFTEEGSVKIAVSFDKENDLMIFSVIDTGIGIKEEHISKLFSAFEQAENSTLKHYGGTGLGLYLSKLIAKNLGGDIHAQSVFGQGSEFTLSIKTIPEQDTDWLNAPPQETVEKESNQKEPDSVNPINYDQSSQHQGRVLAVEDNEVNSQLLQHHLLKMGCDVITASNGLEAISIATNQKIDLILMDIDMPVMDGLTATRQLREKGFSLPIYILTGDITRTAIEECHQAGSDGHLAKPYDTKKIQEVINLHLSKQ